MNDIQFFRILKNSEIDRIKQSIAQAIYDKRSAAGLTQQQLADIIKVDRKTINRIENGLFSPNVDTLVRIFAALEISPQKVLKV